MVNGFSVIMPTYNQAYFIRRAVMSLIRQTYTLWELIIVNDGSTDHTDSMVGRLPHDERIRYLKYTDNRGMGYALNKGLEAARYEHIAYLPSDDFFYADHLKDLKQAFDTDERVVLAYSGVNFDDTDAYAPRSYTDSFTIKNDCPLQLVQASHRKTTDRWTERTEFVTENLFVMFWHKLANQGIFMPTLRITAKWTNHPWQRHKICGEDYGGNIYKYKDYYQIKEPIKIRMNRHRAIDEKETYKPVMLSTPGRPLIKILIIGALNYNPERFCAWEEAGCKLYGYWYPTPSMAHESIGPFPFGHIETIPHKMDWTEQVRSIRPDLIYLCFCCSSLDFVYHSIMELKKAGMNTPFVWHLKEGPQLCMRFGTWPKLMELYELSAGNIITNKRTKEWYDLFVPLNNKPYLILDQEMPKKEYFNMPFLPKMSESDGEIHTVVIGRMIGIPVEDMCQLAAHRIHVHLYSASYYKEKNKGNNLYEKVAKGYFHVHTYCPNEKWIEEFSRYDAGWLHAGYSRNRGDLFRLMWDDLNIPARIGTLAAAGLPMIQRRNAEHIVASKEMLETYGIGVLYDSITELAAQLNNKEEMNILRENVQECRMEFTMDFHMEKVISFFQSIVKGKYHGNT